MQRLVNNNRRSVITGNKKNRDHRVLDTNVPAKPRGDSVGFFNEVDPKKATLTSYSKLLKFK